tara:strand:- start:862 stop:1824 length:963 start_codon:yes stop_codon:yes gene_type:complete
MSNNLFSETSPNMADHNKTTAKLHVVVPHGHSVTLNPKVLCSATGTMDPGHLGITKVDVDHVSAVKNGAPAQLEHPVGVVISTGAGEMLPTEHRVCYASDTQARAGAKAKMVHAVFTTGANEFQKVSMPLTVNSEKTELERQKATARLERWQNADPSKVFGKDGLPKDGVTRVEHPTSDEVVHLVNVESDAPFSKFVKANMGSRTFMGGSYQKADTVPVEGVPHVKMTDDHIKEAARALKEHLTPTGTFSDGLKLSMPCMEGKPDKGTNMHVAITLHRDPMGCVEAGGQAAFTSTANDAAAAPLASKLQALAFDDVGKST